jgi:hypothetical protein
VSCLDWPILVSKQVWQKVSRYFLWFVFGRTHFGVRTNLAESPSFFTCPDRLDSCPDEASSKSQPLRVYGQDKAVSGRALQRVPGCACLDKALMCLDRRHFKSIMSSFQLISPDFSLFLSLSISVSRPVSLCLSLSISLTPLSLIFS